MIKEYIHMCMYIYIYTQLYTLLLATWVFVLLQYFLHYSSCVLLWRLHMFRRQSGTLPQFWEEIYQDPCWVVVSSIFLFSPLFGKLIQFVDFFQMAWWKTPNQRFQKSPTSQPFRMKVVPNTLRDMWCLTTWPSWFLGCFSPGEVVKFDGWLNRFRTGGRERQLRGAGHLLNDSNWTVR